MRICRGYIAVCQGIQGCIGIMKGFTTNGNCDSKVACILAMRVCKSQGSLF